MNDLVDCGVNDVKSNRSAKNSGADLNDQRNES